MSISSLRISGTALTAERVRMDNISQNIANAQTTRSADGGVYRRRVVVFEAVAGEQGEAGGVRVARVEQSDEPFQKVHNPGHPDADPQGYVDMPNVNLVEEMVDLVAASRSYEANVAAANATKTMIARALDLGRG